MKIGIIIGSIREGRKGEGVAKWVLEAARAKGGADYELIDLKEYNLPLLTSATLPAVANRNYDSPEVTRWGQALDACDGYVLVTPEYNHGVPGALKNAIDSVGPELIGKVVAFVGYGAVGGVRSVEQWRQILVNFQMVDVRAQLDLSTFYDFGEHGFAPMERRGAELDSLLDQLLSTTVRHTR